MSEKRIPELTSVRSPSRVSLEYDQLKEDRTHIGSGGQGAVYRVNISSPKLPEQVAVKEPEVDSDTVAIDDVEALLDEADTWETLDRREREKLRWDDSEYIVGIIDIGEENFPWIAMEYMDGGGLDRRLKAYPNGGPVNTALWIGECICQGVEVAHNYGIAHLDLKPSNILFRKTDEDMWDVPKIADWGLSRVLTEQTGSMEKLSVQYAAPEQVDPERFGEPDMLTDVYQVGALTYAMLTGDPPYAGKQASVLHDIVSSVSPTPPSEVRDDLPTAIDEVVLTALEKQKSNRYRNIGEFEKALRTIRTEQFNKKSASQSTNPTNEDRSTAETSGSDGETTTESKQAVGESDIKKATTNPRSNSEDQDYYQLITTNEVKIPVIVVLGSWGLLLSSYVFRDVGIISSIYAFGSPSVGGTLAGWYRINYTKVIIMSVILSVSIEIAYLPWQSSSTDDLIIVFGLFFIITSFTYFISKEIRSWKMS